MMNEHVDKHIKAKSGDWRFSGNVAEHFVDHATRSIPFYREGQELICRLSDTFVSRGSRGYELGTSTGELLKQLAHYNEHKESVSWIGIDSEETMLKQAEKHVAGLKNISFECKDVMDVDFEPSSFIVAYYCIQFIPPKDRQALFDRLYEALEWGGALVVFDKVRAPDARFQDLMTGLYSDYKSAAGFSDAEIMQKSRSLRGVLEPYSSEENRRYFERAGFKDVMSIYKYVSFEGFVGIK
jgi:tRNA (cmo5U34)-methyltransferase